MAKSPDRIQQVETTRKKYGEDHYKKIGSKGGKLTPTKFNSKSGSAAINARWAKYRENQRKEEA